MSPNLSDEQRAFLIERHDFEAWRGRTTLDENLFLWRWAPRKDQFDAWAPVRVRRITPEDSPPFVDSIWERPGSGGDESFTLQAHECESRSAAHELLLELLGEFMSPLLERQDELGIGDVAFGIPGDAGIVFARANLVVALHNAGSQLISIGEVALALDSDLIRRPETGGRTIFPSNLPPRDEAAIGAIVEPPGELGEAMGGLKLFSATGEIFVEDGRLMYRAISGEPHRVEIFALGAGAST